jgi:hypothetical protein
MEYLQIVERLEAIEEDLETRQTDFEASAGEYHRLTRDYELRLARASLAARGDTATERKWRALEAVAASGDGIYESLKVAEGKYEGLKAAVRVLEQRATIGMSLLKAQTRERS